MHLRDYLFNKTRFRCANELGEDEMKTTSSSAVSDLNYAGVMWEDCEEACVSYQIDSS